MFALRLVLIIVLSTATSTAAWAGPVGLQNASATFSQTFNGIPFLVSQSLDGITNGQNNGWAIYDHTQTDGSQTDPQTAVYETVADLTSPAIDIKMTQNHGTAHLLGRFRFSATTDDRGDFADGLQTGGDVSANWTVLTPTLITLPGSMTSSVLGDGSILVGGTFPNTALYVVRYLLPLANVTGLRLEVMTDPSLPFQGPGLHVNNGNLVLSELEVCTAVPEPATAGLVLVAMLARRAPRRRAE